MKKGLSASDLRPDNAEAVKGEVRAGGIGGAMPGYLFIWTGSADRPRCLGVIRKGDLVALLSNDAKTVPLYHDPQYC